VLIHHDDSILKRRDYPDVRILAEQFSLLVGADPCVCPNGGEIIEA
jgi:hypothetical protein